MTDESAREMASDPLRSVWLQAPAGSGKTAVLTERLLRLLAQADQPEDILAITFTRKAAAEMRARVLKALRLELDPTTAIGARLMKYARAVLDRDRVRGWSLLEDPARLRIQTIDSLNFRLASQLSLSGGAVGGLHVADFPLRLYQRAARRALLFAETDARLRGDVELLFERLDNRWRNVERLLSDMLARREHWLPHLLAAEAPELCARINESLWDLVGTSLRELCTALPDAVRQEAAALFGVEAFGVHPTMLPSWKSLVSSTLTRDGSWRKARSGRHLAAAFASPTARVALQGLIDRLASIPGARERMKDLERLPPPRLSALDEAAIEALSRLLQTACAQLHLEFARAREVDHAYIAGAARQALAEQGAPTDLALRMGWSLRHILVDEFQDTSIAQVQLLEALTAGWSSGEGRTLFVVGDPMQSIYQFREAEVGLFLRARERGIGGLRLETHRLVRNFRSTPPLVRWINETFSRVFPREDVQSAGAVAYAPSVPGNANPSAVAQPVSVRIFTTGRDAETRAIVAEISALRASPVERESTVAVLVASRAHALGVMTGLAAAAIPVIGVDLKPLEDVPIVSDLVSLIAATRNLSDRTAWLAVLRAPWCGVGLASLTRLSERHDSQLVWEAMHDEARLARCDEADRLRIARLRAVLAEAFSSRLATSSIEWIERLWLRLGAADCYSACELRHARAFFATVAERLASGDADTAGGLSAALQEVFAEPAADGTNPVQVMTIHRAKGLEFDHVFVPSLDRAASSDAEPLLRWLDLPRPAGGSDLILAPVPAVGARAGEVNSYLKHLSSIRAKNEQTRVLYVAATRARRTLHLTAAPKSKADGSIAPHPRSLLATLWPVVEEIPREAYSPDPQAQEVTSALPPRPPAATQLRRLRSDWTPPTFAQTAAPCALPLAQRSLEPPEFSWVGETARHVGTLVHASLERLGTQNILPSRAQIETCRADYRRRLRRLGVGDAELTRAEELVVEALGRTLDSPRGRWLLSPDHRERRAEWALSGLVAGRLTSIIVDRSFIDEQGSRWVIDFKTSRHEGGGLEAFLAQELERYRPQLETYAELARGWGPEPVRAALYFPLLDAFREL